jgi:hypothetical protein
MTSARAILVFSAVLALPALADDAPAPTPVPAAAQKKAAKTDAKKAAATASPAGTANMVVTRDPETGESRPATAAERERLLGRRPLVAVEHTVVTLPDGTQMIELGDADMTYAVATKNPDGSVSRRCVHGSAAAAKATTPPAPAPAPKAADR